MKEYRLSTSDVKRLKDNINGPSFTIPSGLSREEKRKFIMDCANGKIKPDPKEKK